MKKMKIVGMQVQRMRNILIILALFVCTSICLGQTGQIINITGNNGDWFVDGNWNAVNGNDPVNEDLRVRGNTCKDHEYWRGMWCLYECC